ncbi:MAG: hypothetical protein IKH21_07970 [Clostridia bacterium]|nr:hypothetical protein [Clostridia bacterium]
MRFLYSIRIKALTVSAMAAVLCCAFTGLTACAGNDEVETVVLDAQTAEATAVSSTADATAAMANTVHEGSNVQQNANTALITVECESKYTGGTREYINGSFAMDFVNSTDSGLCEAVLNIGALNIKSATVNGLLTNFSIDDDGKLIIPFFNELPSGGAVDIFFEFDAVMGINERFSLPNMDEGTYRAKVYVSSTVPLSIDGCEYTSSADNGRNVYVLDSESVGAVEVSFVH